MSPYKWWLLEQRKSVKWWETTLVMLALVTLLGVTLWAWNQA